MDEFNKSKFHKFNGNELLQRLENLDDDTVKLLNQQSILNTQTYSQMCVDWLKWCKLQTNRIKVIEHEIPSQILPIRFAGVLCDIKVQGKKCAPDDQLYNNHEDLRYLLAM